MMSDDVPWYPMMSHDVPWCPVMSHDVPWCPMMSHDLPSISLWYAWVSVPCVCVLLNQIYHHNVRPDLYHHPAVCILVLCSESISPYRTRGACIIHHKWSFHLYITMYGSLLQTRDFYLYIGLGVFVFCSENLIYIVGQQEVCLCSRNPFVLCYFFPAVCFL